METDREQIERVKMKIAELREKAREYPEKFGQVKKNKKATSGLSKEETQDLFKMFMEEKMKGEGNENS